MNRFLLGTGRESHAETSRPKTRSTERLNRPDRPDDLSGGPQGIRAPTINHSSWEAFKCGSLVVSKSRREVSRPRQVSETEGKEEKDTE